MRAYLSAARGAFVDAERRARALLDDTSVAVEAALTLGSVLRQTARHAEAQHVDMRALHAAPDDERRAHALISLGADAIGMADAELCATRLREAVLPRGAWRAAVRHAWVRTELALITDDTSAAVEAARDALRRSRRASARRHEAKTLLFLGVALQARASAGSAAALQQARDLAQSLGARPIADVAGSLLQRRG